MGKGPKHFKTFFRQKQQQQRRNTRLEERRHSKQLEDPRHGYFPELLRRSALGLIAVYNLLPKRLVEATTVKDFQSQLQEELKKRAEAGREDWTATFSPRVP